MNKTPSRTTDVSSPKSPKSFSPRAFYQKHAEIINYLIVGCLTTVVSLGVKYALLFTILDANDGIQLQISVVTSWVAAVIFAYFTNRRFVFHSQNPHIFRELLTFVSGRLITLGLESLTLWFFITFLGLSSNLQVVIWTLLAQFIVFVGNYIISKLIVFRKKRDIITP